jgi:hypothetical protein
MDLRVLEHNLQHLSDLQPTVQDIHPVLRTLHPVAVVEDDHFHIFDVDPANGQWAFVKRAPTPMPVPEGVRAAFPLACYGGQAACIVTGEIFDAEEGYATLFHEFVHCHQAETCEPALKTTLHIAQRADNPMWEITYPFPYDDARFTAGYRRFLNALQANDYDAVRASRRDVHQGLDPDDVEYMVWQEWKEGLARFIENRIRSRWGLAANHGGGLPPYDRVAFYEGGARFIEVLEAHTPGVTADLEALFTTMMRFPCAG